MIVKSILIIMILAGCTFIFKSFGKNSTDAETLIDKAWWDGLNEEWKTILLINQNFSKQHTNIYAVQNGYINRLNAENEDDYSEMNKSLHDLHAQKKFSLGYPDFYARALRTKFVTENKNIDLEALADLDIIYMVNGPGDLTPLKKFSNLKVLILTDCGIDNAVPIKSQVLDLEPLRYLKKLQVLHCSSHALRSIEPIRELVSLQELRLDNSSVTDLSPLKKLINLTQLSVGSKVKKASVIARLINLKALYLDGFRKLPNFSKLQRLSALSICEDEMAIVDRRYRISSLGCLTALKNLEYLDLDYTSYRSNLADLESLQNLKAVTMSSVGWYNMSKFKEQHKKCVIINSHDFEW